MAKKKEVAAKEEEPEEVQEAVGRGKFEFPNGVVYGMKMVVAMVLRWGW